jgi:hypothetical protein
MRLTRRELAAALASSTALAQTGPRPPETPDDLLKAAHDRVRAAAELLAKEQVPMAAEPAFQFKA